MVLFITYLYLTCINQYGPVFIREVHNAELITGTLISNLGKSQVCIWFLSSVFCQMRVALMKVFKKNPETVLDGTQAYEQFIEIVLFDLEISGCFP